MVVMMASKARAAIIPAIGLIGPNISRPALDRPRTTIQIHNDGHSFSVYRTPEVAGVFRAGTGEDWSGVGMYPAYPAADTTACMPAGPQPEQAAPITVE
ncbi:hypothetical protein StoSoilB3_17190 [Arthrobacter sp. StoSoilB3]|nr:hypothetical protein NtRootA2_17070 [Arthrobacter sp. NtRootA2]BCW14505.1 hypothetical protein NtRootA4_14840 [Arthrobacter sp. NtRootA4]BCW22840.1 hypothetical protein NtRootC7_17070 [Arthrobacter sp. NtRootC7]BCW27110.1 hypothetical protein NtRootC45_17100 [Arthrobacter sp. NtRootC45]BCW31378.1 hypothetical protein NtRootD5_17090 [Arthrobacter sp. NtRootD5]BCW40184.1 hypothetical protein StoSoilB3_17190 [Arthrobacter sp. StoSoilB3]GGV28937.1 hypothetical protein GCM10010212_14540 [Paenar